jgi:hypothetical protein
VLCDDTDSDGSDPVLVLDVIEMVAERLLEPVPVGDSEPISVQGRLHGHADFWLNELEASAFVRDIITQGYRIPFLKVPWPVFKCIHRSALEHEEFISTAIKELVQTGCVVPSDQCPAVCSLLSVVTNAKGKLRLVLDLRYV